MGVCQEEYLKGAEWALERQKEELIKKTCDWLLGHTIYPYTDKGNVSRKKLDAFKRAVNDWI